ncbi:MAG: hypothetical protein ACQEQU_04815 [Spirochaetota bacterium]
MNLIRLDTNFEVDFSWFARTITLETFPELEGQARELFALAKEKLVPQSIHAEAFITDGKHNDISCITVEGITFEGKILKRLSDVHRVFPYISTCGTGLESVDLSAYDFLAPYWVDILKTRALQAAQAQLKRYVKEHYGLKLTNSLNPGSGNVDIWPIEQMHQLFNLFGGKQTVLTELGVQLTESSLMIPNKTVAGLLFDAEFRYDSCAYCSRKNCPDRRVPQEYTI